MTAHRRTAWFCAANAALPLLAGGLVYVVWTADTGVSAAVRELLRQAGFGSLPVRQPGGAAARFIRNYLCDACWAYALVFCLAPAMNSIPAAVCTAAAFAAALELLQKTPILNGTFDRADLIVESAACLAAGVMLKCFVGRKDT